MVNRLPDIYAIRIAGTDAVRLSVAGVVAFRLVVAGCDPQRHSDRDTDYFADGVDLIVADNDAFDVPNRVSLGRAR